MEVTSVYKGTRGNEFKAFISSLLILGDLKEKYINILTKDSSMAEYNKAFTAASANKVSNYETFEQLGDVSANKFIVWYAYKRFPQLNCTEGVKVVARLRILYGAKECFAPLAEKYGFWPFISALEDGNEKGQKYRNRNKKDLLEDCFEAFVGCTEYLLDQEYMPGVGYGIIYKILGTMFNTIEMSLQFEDLFDSKTRLKETFDLYSELGKWTFIDKREQGSNEYGVAKSELFQVPPNSRSEPIKRRQGSEIITLPQSNWIKIGEGNASIKSVAQQKAASQGINNLKSKGYYRKPPPEYARFSSQ